MATTSAGGRDSPPTLGGTSRTLIEWLADCWKRRLDSAGVAQTQSSKTSGSCLDTHLVPQPVLHVQVVARRLSHGFQHVRSGLVEQHLGNFKLLGCKGLLRPVVVDDADVVQGLRERGVVL